MTDLSPQAQAVLDAFGRHPLHGDNVAESLVHGALPAALRAAADQVVPEEVHPQIYEYCCDYSSLMARAGVRAAFLAIANELEQFNA